jgi:hypothetical protein
MQTHTALRGAPHKSNAHISPRGVAAAIGTLAIALLLAIVPVNGNDAAFAATPFAQCNGVDNTPGLGITCNVTITNTFNAATGVGSSVTVLTECHGAANTAPSSCVTTSRSGNTVISSVSQCNSSINGGGGTVICNVRVTNNITGASTVTGATVNACIGSGGGGGTEPTLACNPGGSSSGATVTQCNGSANGGGGSMRVRCSVIGSTTSSALSVTINQCNGSANGGGSTVTCTAAITNNVVAASSGGGGGGTDPVVAPPAAVVPVVPTAAQIAQTKADLASAGAVQSSLASMSGPVVASRGSVTESAFTAAATARAAARAAAAAALAESLAHAGFEAAGFIGGSVIAGAIGFALFFIGHRKNKTHRPARVTTPAHI